MISTASVIAGRGDDLCDFACSKVSPEVLLFGQFGFSASRCLVVVQALGDEKESPADARNHHSMTDLKASRTLVKSSPELWAECSDAASLTRHLEAFGEIRITRLEPETAVAWEGDAASGTVRLEPAGWGTRVVLTARPADGAPARAEMRPQADQVATATAVDPDPDPNSVSQPGPEFVASAAIAAEAGPESEAESESPAPGPFGRLLRLLGRRRRPDHEPVAAAPSEPLPERPVEPGQPQPGRRTERGPARKPQAGGTPVGAAALDAALDSLGRAHHRPYSRS